MSSPSNVVKEKLYGNRNICQVLIALVRGVAISKLVRVPRLRAATKPNATKPELSASRRDVRRRNELTYHGRNFRFLDGN